MYGGNSKIERKVRSEILSLPYYGVFDAIGYQINGNTVTLNGYVVRPITKSDIENTVEDIDGVGKVVNNIEVLPLSPNDDRIRRQILQTLSNRGRSLLYYFTGTNPTIPNYRQKRTCFRSKVTLTAKPIQIWQIF